MQKRKFDELVSFFNKEVSEMEIETKYKMELLGMVTALGCAHEKEMSDLSEIKRDSSDLISRQAAIDAVLDMNAGHRVSWKDAVIDVIDGLPSAGPEIIHCRECKHRPIATRADEGILWGFSVEFPDERCPLQCEDGWYSHYPKDDFYCANAERGTDEN